MLQDKIKNRTATVSIIGLGYVGLPLALESMKCGFDTIGIDIDRGKINRAIRESLDISREANTDCWQSKFTTTDNLDVLHSCDVIVICVPTPLTTTKDPDLSHVVSVVKKIGEHLHKEQLVILESTTYPGTTREVVLPILEDSGLVVGKDFYLVFSPERIDPGNAGYPLTNVPKVIGGITSDCTEMATLYYKQIFDRVIPVLSTEEAEMVKMLENTFRSVNIALVNELAMYCNLANINIVNVINAAATKPFGFMPFYPGPGVGGHCIPIDPLYLTWLSRKQGLPLQLVETSDQINRNMPQYSAIRVERALSEHGKDIKDSNILVLGVAYKRDSDDIRESPSLEIIKILKTKGAVIQYHDPYVNDIVVNGETLLSVKLSKDSLQDKDCVIIATNHSCYDYTWLLSKCDLLLDLRIFGNNQTKRD